MIKRNQKYNKEKKAFSEVAVFDNNEKWEKSISRKAELYQRKHDIRSEFNRDYTRILHSMAYRRLKHKTQVFFSPQNDHICTRMEHVTHVDSVSYTISNYLGLNTELTKAISAGHDLGHAPFGHLGETIIGEIAKGIGSKFWHERNGLRFVDDLELLEDAERNKTNLNLTYAVRDGIISHCGEVDQNGLKPRDSSIDLDEYQTANQFPSFTWEGCIVKISDKISYLGRDIDDAIALSIITRRDMYGLIKYITGTLKFNMSQVNTTYLMHEFIIDLCKNSSPEKGICLSDRVFDLMNAVKSFNYEQIYRHSRLNNYRDYARLIIRKLYDILCEQYNGLETDVKLNKYSNKYPRIFSSFNGWIKRYWDLTNREKNFELKNKIVYRIANGEKEYQRAVLDYIAGMTDQYAIRAYNEIVTYR